MEAAAADIVTLITESHLHLQLQLTFVSGRDHSVNSITIAGEGSP